TTWYADADGDSYGDPLVSQVSCSQPTGYVADDTDCDDADFNVNPSATEVCNGVDDNCDALVDAADPNLVDNEPPTVSCQNINVSLDANGMAQIIPTQIVTLLADNCVSVSAVLSVSNFTCSNIGANPVIATAIDGSGNTATCTATVTIVDNLPPTVTCQNITVPLDASGNVVITPSQVSSGASDNCGSPVLGLNISNFSCANIGANTVTLTAIDGSNNTASCTATVTVEDNLPPTAVCQNITVPLNASGTATITPSQINNGSSDNCGLGILSLSQINFSCANTGAPVTVTLTVPDVNGNTATCTASVTVVDNLPPTTICQNFSVSLDPNGLATIAPSDVDNGSSDNCGAPILSISQTSFDCSNIGVNNVTLTANDASGNASTCTATVAVSSMLMVNAGSDVTICSGSSTQLNATASGANGIAYAWTPTTGLSDANIANPVASPASTTAYTVTASANGCSATDQVTVTVAPAPTATITAANAVCQGNNISLSETGGSPGVTWAWSGPNGFSSTLQNPTITNASPLNAGQYSVAVSNGSGCSATASATVAVNSLPTANAGADVSICAGSTAQLQATGGTGYAWSPAASLNNATIANPIASPTATTTYTVTVTDGNNCTATDTVVVTVTPQPTISGVLADCDANLTTYTIELTSNASQLTASAGIVTNNGGGAWTVSDIQVGTNVTLAATAAGGCTAMQQVTSPNCNCPALAAPSPSGNADVEHCEGLANPAFGVTVGSGETADWYDSPSGGNLLASGVLDFTPLQNTPGVYNFYVETKVIANGCTSLVRTHFTLTILQNPTADAGSDANICTGVSVQLDGSGSSSANGALSYAWSPAASLNDPMLVNPTATPGAATTYTLTVTDPKGCMDDASVNVNISTVNPPLAGANQAICAGATIPALIVSLNGGETADWYSAATGGVLLAQGTASYTPTAAGTFYVETRLLAGGCTSTSRTPISLTINSLPMANATAGSPVCAGGSVQLDASSSLGLAPLNFVWSNGAVIANPVVSPANTTNYTVTVTDGNGCSATAQTTAIVNANPTLTLGSLACDVNLINYSFSVTLGGVDQLTSTAGTVTGAGTSYTVTAPSGQNLQLTATNSFTGCASQQVVTGLVCGCPTILAPVSSGDKTICEGAPTPALSVTVGANETADWFTQAAGGVAAATGTTSFTPNQTAPGIYTYFVETRYTLNSGCLSSTRTPIQLIINALPTANAGNDAAICASETTTLSGSGTGAGSLSYAWSPAILLTNANTATPDFTAASAGLQPFTLTVTDGNGCSATDNVTLDVADKPSLAINSPACNGLSYSVSFTTNADQVAASVGTVTGGAGAFTVTDIPSLTDVSITVTNSTTGCSQGQTVAGISCSCAGLVAVPISGGNQVVCAGATIPALTVTVGVGETANWYDAPTGGTLLTANMTSYTPPVAGTYYAEAVNTAIGCVSDLRMPVVLTINPLPTATITPSGATTFCEGNSVDLTASGGTGFSWSSGETTATISAAATDIYIVTVTGAGGCTATASSNVTVNPTPAATISGDADLCLGENSVLTASGGTGYSWSTGVSSQTITISAAADAVYAVTVTGTGGCTATASVNVAVHALPVADAGADLVFCTNTNGALLDASGSSGVGILNFEWSPSAGLSATDIVNPVASPTVDATYVLTVTDGNGCTSTDEVSVSLHDAPMSVLSTNSPICMNEDLELEETGGEAIAWLWTVPSGSTFASQNPTVPHADVEEGVYSLEITDAFGCSSLTDFDVTLSAGVAFEAKFLTTNVACEGDTVHFIEISQTTTLPDGFSWDFGDGMGSTERDPAHVYTDAGTYQVSVVVTEAGCENFSVAKEININNCRLSGGDDGILSYNLYPTVTSGRLRMDLELQERELLHLDIFDVFGKLVESRTKRDVMHINEEFRIDDPGIYFMHIRTLQGQLTLKFIVVRA
ncbi:MAG: HYR domain-containing protein, partial [Bacteroidetes bacterium]|nr:HYR domain-containing protein [Bacteroidota bacterium]